MITDFVTLQKRYAEQGGIFDEDIYLPDVGFKISDSELGVIRFENTRFVCKEIIIEDIHNNNLEIYFTNCEIQAEISIRNCEIRSLGFWDLRALKKLNIVSYQDKKFNCSFNHFYFQNSINNNPSELSTKFTISNCEFISGFTFESIFLIDGELNLTGNTFGRESDESNTSFSIKDSTIANCQFISNKFLDKLNISSCKFIDTKKQNSGSTIFHDNFFTELYFLNCLFYGNCVFSKSVVGNKSNFDIISSNSHLLMRFIGLKFVGETNFSNSTLSSLEIIETDFKDNVSFQDITVNSIFFNLSMFEKTALFDGIKIININQCNRKTLRQIKQQLQKAENKIDYNRFRSYELSAYYKELKWYGDFKDKFILGVTWLATGFDHSWRRALVFSLFSGLLFYSLFFISENYMFQRDLSQWKEFASGYFRFLLVTDFYSPLAKGRTYIDNTNTIGWFLFIIGKIVIAFGIYEMIQAFRKFKA